MVVRAAYLRGIFLALCITVRVHAASADPIAAAGRIERTDGSVVCSAVLVTPDIIVSAAHCLPNNPDAEARGEAQGDGVSNGGLLFRPGVPGAARRYRLVRTVWHPLYLGGRSPWRLRFDMAAARLDAPVPPEIAVPLQQGEEARPGERLFVVSWRDPDGTQPRQRACPVVSGRGGLVVLGCEVKGGESGAPVLRRGERGLELVAILSSRSQIARQPVGQGSNVWLRLRPLLDALRR